jgi:hypothetical protein
MIYLVVSHRLIPVVRKLADHLTDHLAIAESAVVLHCLAPLCVCVCVCVCARARVYLSDCLPCRQQHLFHVTFTTVSPKET